MTGRESVALGMLADIGQAQRARILDQDAEDTPTARELADPAVDRLVETRRDEPVELLAGLVEDPQRGVPSAGQALSLLEDSAKHGVRVKLGYQRLAHVKQAPKPLLYLSHAPGLIVHLGLQPDELNPAGRSASVGQPTRTTIR